MELERPINANSTVQTQPVHSGASNVKIPAWGEKSRMDDYLQTCERLLRLSKVPPSLWVCQLIPYLPEKARSVYNAMPLEQANDYEPFKKQLLARYALPTKVYRRNFFNWVKRPYESYDEYVHSLRKQLRHWVDAETEEGQVPDYEELFLQYRLEQNMPEEIRLHVLGVKSLSESVKSADRYVMNRRVISQLYRKRRSHVRAPRKVQSQRSPHRTAPQRQEVKRPYLQRYNPNEGQRDRRKEEESQEQNASRKDDEQEQKKVRRDKDRKERKKRKQRERKKEKSRRDKLERRENREKNEQDERENEETRKDEKEREKKRPNLKEEAREEIEVALATTPARLPFELTSVSPQPTTEAETCASTLLSVRVRVAQKRQRSFCVALVFSLVVLSERWWSLCVCGVESRMSVSIKQGYILRAAFVGYLGISGHSRRGHAAEETEPSSSPVFS